jgi:hypothetical protein
MKSIKVHGTTRWDTLEEERKVSPSDAGQPLQPSWLNGGSTPMKRYKPKPKSAAAPVPAPATLAAPKKERVKQTAPAIDGTPLSPVEFEGFKVGRFKTLEAFKVHYQKMSVSVTLPEQTNNKDLHNMFAVYTRYLETYYPDAVEGEVRL